MLYNRPESVYIMHMAAMDKDKLMDKVKLAPTSPGCYLFRDAMGYIIYVGKAKNLRNRVRSYFTPASRQDERIAKLVYQICDAEYMETESELDALLLEYRLIKRHKPWFNSQLKPDLPRPYLRVSKDEPYATITISESIADDSYYYDFFTDEYDAMDAIALIGRAWGLPQCRQRSFAKRQSPCPYQSMDGCKAPCAHRPKPAEYAVAIDGLRAFLDGSGDIFDALERDMQSHADALRFEKAAAVKALMDGLRRLQYKSRRRFHIPEKGRVLVLIRPYREKAFSAFYIRDGRVYSREDFSGYESSYREYAASLGEPAQHMADSEWLPRCLAEVIAYKRIIVLPGSYKRLVASAMKEFAKEPLIK